MMLYELMSFISELRRLLECPVCLTTVRTDVATCSNGHMVCDLCLPNLRECPLCRTKIFGFPCIPLRDICRLLPPAPSPALTPRVGNAIGNVSTSRTPTDRSSAVPSALDFLREIVDLTSMGFNLYQPSTSPVQQSQADNRSQGRRFTGRAEHVNPRVPVRSTPPGNNARPVVNVQQAPPCLYGSRCTNRCRHVCSNHRVHVLRNNIIQH
ncbi:E3 ubiquitin-protein ligase [Gryllus bimaculatus]|nr:E3 ubiquitin-protein ligase [Gryllus bimaculatus]